MSDASTGQSVHRQLVPGSCPECGAFQLAEYPVLSTGGWFVVVKCQVCLASLQRTKWNRLGYVDRDQADRILPMQTDTGS